MHFLIPREGGAEECARIIERPLPRANFSRAKASAKASAQVGLEEWPSGWSAKHGKRGSSASFFFFSCLRRSLAESSRALGPLRDEERIGTILSAEDRANPRTTKRWTTWRHAASEIAARVRRRRGEKMQERAERARARAREGKIERSRFLGTDRPATKRFRSFDIPNPPRSCSFCHRPRRIRPR
jgi:hypothetical protein